jgi:hypothetical protein
LATSLESTLEEFKNDGQLLAGDTGNIGMEAGDPFGADSASPTSSNDEMDFWVRLFMQASDLSQI